MIYEQRTYRKHMQCEDLVQFNVTDGESDIQFFARSYLRNKAQTEVRKYRRQLIEYIKKHPEFLTSLVPIEPKAFATDIVKHMSLAAAKTGVGPMAAVAGAISQYVGYSLLQYTDEIILENGGDIFIKSPKEKRILINAGESPFSNKIALLIPGGHEPVSICTSSGTVGHAFSFGKTDAAVVVGKDALLADAGATAVGNLVKTPQDIDKGIKFVKTISGIDGVLIIIGDKMGLWGNINLVRP